MDESTPHMHLGIVPMVEGNYLLNRCLTEKNFKIQKNDLPKYLNENGYDIHRGERR